VKVKCFGCDAVIEADDSDTVVDPFVAHGQKSHTWPYPEEPIRTYARDYAEATQRLTGGSERLSEIGDITVHPVTDERIQDWLRFFDHDAFAGNPEWASCYCLEPHVPATPEQPERAWRETRSTMADRLRARTTVGYLAYVGGRPVGWINAQCAPTIGCTETSPADRIRHRSLAFRASSSLHRFDGTGSRRRSSTA